jgi:hypothetical protein
VAVGKVLGERVIAAANGAERLEQARTHGAAAAALGALVEGGCIVSAGFASGRSSALDPVRLHALGGALLTANTILEAERHPAAARDALGAHGSVSPAWRTPSTMSPAAKAGAQ